MILHLYKGFPSGPEPVKHVFGDLFPLCLRVVVYIGVEEDHPDNRHEAGKVIDEELHAVGLQCELESSKRPRFGQFTPEPPEILIVPAAEVFSREVVVEPGCTVTATGG